MTKRDKIDRASPHDVPPEKKSRVVSTDDNKDKNMNLEGEWTLDRARDFWSSAPFPTNLREEYNDGFLFLKKILSCEQSMTVIDGQEDYRKIQYHQFLKLVNSLNICERIHPLGKIETLQEKVLSRVPGFSVLNEEAERVLQNNKNVSESGKSPTAQKSDDENKHDNKEPKDKDNMKDGTEDEDKKMKRKVITKKWMKMWMMKKTKMMKMKERSRNKKAEKIKKRKGMKKRQITKKNKKMRKKKKRKTNMKRKMSKKRMMTKVKIFKRNKKRM